ncbi:MAG: DUF115 domain-containing protein [Treponema sp.]|jgi:hypothetical protein|nr:DUF115 domain-containing protein [Treponema sp.]
MNYWEINSSVIRDKFPGLLEQIADSEVPYDGDIQAEVSASGSPTLTVKGRYVHSPRDPMREARRLAETITGSGAVVILGFGLGYAAEAAAEKAAHQPIIIVEAHKGLLKKAFETRNLAVFLSENQLIFVVGGAGDGVIGALQFCESRFHGKEDTPSLIRNSALTKLDENWYAQVERHIKVWVSKDDINMATLRRFGKRWVRNLARNVTAIRDLPGIEPLAGILHTPPLPVFLAAAGPSLDEVVPFFPEIYKRCVIVGVDTSLRLLLRSGIDPDFTVVVDPQYWNWRHLDRSPALRTCLIAESAVYPPVLIHPFARRLLCSSLFPLGKFIEDQLDPKGRLGAGGSVATTAWDFARFLGASAVWIGGLDLSYPGLKTHFKGALFEDRALAESNRFNPVESWSVRSLREGQPFFAPSAAGGVVLTDRRLSLYAAWFENRFQDTLEMRNYRLSGEGIAISGLSTASIEELLSLPIQRPEIDQRLSAVFAQIDKDFSSLPCSSQRNAQYQGIMKELLTGLIQLKGWAEDAAGLAERAYRRYRNSKSPPSPQEQDHIAKKLDRTNKRINESPVKEVASFLFPPVSALETSLESTETEPFFRYLELSAKLYRSIDEVVGYHLEALGK